MRRFRRRHVRFLLGRILEQTRESLREDRALQILQPERRCFQAPHIGKIRPLQKCTFQIDIAELGIVEIGSLKIGVLKINI